VIESKGTGDRGARQAALSKKRSLSTISIPASPAPGTSKWNKIEHRMFNHISMNWRGRALTTREIIVNLIGETKSKSGLKIRAALDEGIYPTGRKASDQEMSHPNNKTRHSNRHQPPCYQHHP